jgi:two-component system, chemotaxis family, chemotaxis protein CheY
MNENKPKILLIDDDENIRSMYAEVFAGAGFLVSQAQDGAEGLEKANGDVPDVIFTGIDMPRMDGFTLIEILRKDPVTANIKIIMSSHRGRKEDETRARELKVNDFIILGMVTPRQVVERIKSTFRDKKYFLKFDPLELDAIKIASDLNISEQNYHCPNCGRDLVLSLEVLDAKNNEFRAKFVCPICN